MTALAGTPIPTDPAGWEQYRQSLIGIGGSDAASVLGLSSFESPFEFWERVKGLRRREETEPMRRGRRFEDDAADWYSERTGRVLNNVPMTIRDPRWPDLFVHPDRIVEGEARLVEIKTGSHRWQDVPPHVEAQVRLELALTGMEVADVALLTWHDLYVYEVEADPILQDRLCERLEEWWQIHYVGNVPPRDTSAAYARALGRESVVDEVQPATREQIQLAHEVLSIRARIDELERDEAEYKTQLMESMRGAIGLVGPGFRIAWKPTKPITRTNWRGLAEGLLRLVPEEERAALIGLHSKDDEPMRPFRLTPTAEEE